MAHASAADGQEMVFASFPIEKWEDGPDGSVYVYGKASTPEVDTDEQIVDDAWSGSALEKWMASGPNLRVMHNAQRDPAGSGLKVEINRDGDGAHWVKSIVDEPSAVRLVKKGHLRAYSVGIARPVIERDMTGKARGGIIRGGELAELSLVDRPANRSCTLELVKAGKSGNAEFTGTLTGDADILAKGAEPEVTKAAKDDLIKASVSFKPSDLEKLLKLRGDLEKGDDSDQDEPDNDQDDDDDASPGDTADDSDSDMGGQDDAGKAAQPDAEKKDYSADERREAAGAGHALPDGSYPIKNGTDLHNAAVLARSGHGDAAAAKKLIARRAKELGVANPLDDDAAKAAGPETAKADGEKCGTCHGSGKIMDGNRDCPDCGPGDKPDAEKAAKPGKMPCPNCGKMGRQKFCGKCGAPMMAEKAGKPTPAAGVTGVHADAVPEHREPDGEAVESFEYDAGMPTVPDDSVRARMRHKNAGADPADAVLHDLLCPAFSPEATEKCHPGMTLAEAASPEAWGSKAMDVAASAPLDQAGKALQLWQHAARLAGLAPETAASMREGAHKAFQDANPGPSSFPTPAQLTPGAFHRPYISDGHGATPSPSGTTSAHIPSGGISAAQFSDGYVDAGHASESPDNDGAGPPVTPPQATGTPSRVFYRNSDKESAEAMAALHDDISRRFPDLCPMGAPNRDAHPPAAPGPVPTPVGTPPAMAARKGGEPEVTKAFSPDLIKSAVADAVAPLLARLDGQAGELKAARKALKAQGRTLEAMADLPDPRTAAYRGAALTKSAPLPAGAETVAEARERSQAATLRMLYDTARSDPDPAQREAAWGEIYKHGYPDLNKLS
jgi:hypothetical protein